MGVKTVARPKVTRPKFKSVDDALIYMSESMAASHAEAERIMAESRAEAERIMAESRAETKRSLAESEKRIADYRAETDRIIAESEKRIADYRAETERIIAKTRAEVAASDAKTDERINRMSEKVEEVSAGIGTMGRKFGDLVEMVVIPGIRKEMNGYGHDFRRSYADKVIKSRKQQIAEVDLFLYNGTEAMAVEIKAGLTVDDVRKHVKRLRTLRKYEAESNVIDKKLYGAMAGVYVEDNARELALKNGLYVLEILEEEKKLKTDAPKRCGIW